MSESVEREVDPKTICEFLVDLTNRRGAPDNVTVAILRYDGEVNDGPPVCLLCSDEEAKDLYRLVLRREGYRMIELREDEMGALLAMPAQEQPRLVIIDHAVSASALELCRTLTTSSETTGIPVLVVTHGKVDVDAGRDAGARNALRL